MKQFDYLVKAFDSGVHKKRHWLVTAIATVFEGGEDYKKDAYLYRLVKQADGFYCITNLEDFTLEKIEDVDQSREFLKFLDPIKTNRALSPNASSLKEGEYLDTYVGNVLFNRICISDIFGSERVPFLTGRQSIRTFEKRIAGNLRKTPMDGEEREVGVFYVDELVNFANVVNVYGSLSSLGLYSATEKTITKAPGTDEYKEKLIAEYGDRLNDPIAYAEFESKLKVYDDAYLEGDETNGIFMSGKVRNISRKKMFLTVGYESAITNEKKLKPIINSLDQGWDTSPEAFAILNDANRSASFSRGAETVKGGVIAKTLIRALSTLKIEPDDCGTTVGLKRYVRTEDVKTLIGRSVLTKTGWSLISTEEQALTYTGSLVELRSPMYCKKIGDNLCAQCMGQYFADNPDAITNTALEISRQFITMYMKAMHGKVLSVASYDLGVFK